MRVRAEKVAVPAADLDLDGPIRVQTPEKVPHRSGIVELEVCVVAQSLLLSFFRARLTVIRRPRKLMPESLVIASEA